MHPPPNNWVASCAALATSAPVLDTSIRFAASFAKKLETGESWGGRGLDEGDQKGGGGGRRGVHGDTHLQLQKQPLVSKVHRQCGAPVQATLHFHSPHPNAQRCDVYLGQRFPCAERRCVVTPGGQRVRAPKQRLKGGPHGARSIIQVAGGVFRRCRSVTRAAREPMGIRGLQQCQLHAATRLSAESQ